MKRVSLDFSHDRHSATPALSAGKKLPVRDYVGRDGVLDTERGLVIELLAICAFLLVIVLFGFAIDLPFTHAAVMRGQNAIDFGSAQSIWAYNDPDALARAAFVNTHATMQNEFNNGIGPRYSSGLADPSSDHAIFVPSFGNHHPYTTNVGDIFTDFRAYQCDAVSSNCSTISSNPRSAYFASIIDRNFDVNGIDDFRNAVMFYGKFTPYHFLPFLPDRPTQLLSVVRIQNVMTYILIDPAFPVIDESIIASNENYNLLFGTTMDSDGTNDVNMWPVAAVRKLDGGTGAIINPLAAKDGLSTEYWATQGYPAPTDANLFYNKDPVTGTTYTNPATPNDYAKRIYHFYASTCDSMPFMYFKEAPVNLIDRLSNSSAFNPTTLVGLTGYSYAGFNTLIPVQPANSDTSDVLFSQFPGAGEYPLPKNATESHNKYLHSAKPAAFTGFVNTLDPRPTAVNPDTGLNRWELCYCRGLYGQADPGDIVGYAAPEDLSSDTSSEASHVNRDRRVRSTTLASNWCDDDTATSNVVELGYGRSGASPSDPNETARNIVANLAIRPLDTRIQNVRNPDTTWTRPTKTEYGNGFRWLPGAITTACQQLKDSADSYNTDVDYGIARPVTTKAMTVFAFGLYSKSALTQSGNTPSEAKDEFRQALKDCACNSPSTMLFLNFLPMTQEDRAQVTDALDVIKDFETDYNFSTVGLDSPTGSPCDNGRSSAIFTMVYDYTNERFATSAGGPVSVGTAKLNAARAFASETYEIINKLLIEYVYSS
ncbi:MAG: hypothetical protein U0136_08230 [Bdellovibrionota bacterium]